MCQSRQGRYASGSIGQPPPWSPDCQSLGIRAPVGPRRNAVQCAVQPQEAMTGLANATTARRTAPLTSRAGTAEEEWRASKSEGEVAGPSTCGAIINVAGVDASAFVLWRRPPYSTVGAVSENDGHAPVALNGPIEEISAPSAICSLFSPGRCPPACRSSATSPGTQPVRYRRRSTCLGIRVCAGRLENVV